MTKDSLTFRRLFHSSSDRNNHPVLTRIYRIFFFYSEVQCEVNLSHCYHIWFGASVLYMFWITDRIPSVICNGVSFGVLALSSFLVPLHSTL